MNWFDVTQLLDTAQLFGYAGTACFLFNAALLAVHQKTSVLYWTVAWAGNGVWLAAGILMEQPAVVLDVLVFLPPTAVGCWRFWRDYDVPGKAWRNWTKEAT